MESVPRRVEAAVEADLEEKMVFLAGPRQCGKTTVARHILARHPGAYLNYDAAEHRALLRAQSLPEGDQLWVFDEIHKMKTWRNWLKGIYDLHGRRHPILVTGSARLDAYRRGGDSLQGRYFLHRMHPFTLSELCGLPPPDIAGLPELPVNPPPDARERLADLMRLGGFPEPLLSASDRRAARWRLGYGTRLVREELRDLERVRDLDKVELLFDRLPIAVGSVLSVNSFRADLEVAFETVRNWIATLERLYAVFRVPPLGAPRIKAVKKEQKLYFWDWGRVEAEPARFENLVLLHLLRLCHWLEDVEGERAELRYLRDVAGHEVDAVVLRKGKPWLAVEVKVSDRPLDGNLRYFLERVHIPFAYQVSLAGTIDRRLPDINRCAVRQVPATRFLSNLP